MRICLICRQRNIEMEKCKEGLKQVENGTDSERI